MVLLKIVIKEMYSLSPHVCGSEIRNIQRQSWGHYHRLQSLIGTKSQYGVVKKIIELGKGEEFCPLGMV